MALEQRSAGSIVDVEFVNFHNHLVSILTHSVFGLLNGFFKEVLVPIERELVHGIDLGEVIQDEEEHSCSLSAASETFTGIVDSLHVGFGVFEFSLHAV